jgi:hypothetical protein
MISYSPLEKFQARHNTLLPIHIVLKRSFAVREASLAVILKHFKAIKRNKTFFFKRWKRKQM